MKIEQSTFDSPLEKIGESVFKKQGYLPQNYIAFNKVYTSVRTTIDTEFFYPIWHSLENSVYEIEIN